MTQVVTNSRPSPRYRPYPIRVNPSYKVVICALFAQIPGEGASPRVCGEAPHPDPDPDPLHSPSKTGVNALTASGVREQRRRTKCALPASGGGKVGARTAARSRT